jgi:hypothetical protein
LRWQRFGGRGRLRRQGLFGRLFFGLFSLGAARRGGLGGRLTRGEVHDADALFLMFGWSFDAEGEQHEQQERRDQYRQADRKRAARRPDAEPFNVGIGGRRCQVMALYWWRRPLAKVPGATGAR